jgi:hypothetical protein
MFSCFLLNEVWTLADHHNVGDNNETAESEDMLTDLADKLSNIDAEMHALEEEYQKDLLDYKQVFLYSPSQICVIIELFNGCDTVTLLLGLLTILLFMGA